MTRTEHLLTILAEECAEVIQRVSKALRFGIAEIEPGQEKTNAQRIMDEFNDLVAVYNMLAGPVAYPKDVQWFYGRPQEWLDAMTAKYAKVEKFLRYSEECGTLTPDGAPA